MKIRMPILAAALAAFTATAAFAQTPQSVIQLLKDDFDIVAITPTADGYTVFLEEDDEVMICQIVQDGGATAFSTERCLPLTR